MASLQELKNTLDSSILSAAAAAEALGLASNAQNEAQVAYDIALAESITNGTLKVMSNVDALLLNAMLVFKVRLHLFKIILPQHRQR